MKGKLKLPESDEECRALLRDICGRTEEQIDAFFQVAKLAKELENYWKEHKKLEKLKQEKKNLPWWKLWTKRKILKDEKKMLEAIERRNESIKSLDQQKILQNGVLDITLSEEK